MTHATEERAPAAPCWRAAIDDATLRVHGDRLYADSVDRYLAALGWKLGWLEAAERALIVREVGTDMVAVDVGANLGFHTLTLGRCVGRTGRVHALEPDPRNFRLLARAVAAADLPQVRLHALAAADREGELPLYLSGANRGDHRLFAAAAEGRAAIGVTATTLDALLAGERRVDFVKIDAQGAEVAVLAGLRRTLARAPDLRILCELSPALLHEAGATAADFFAPFDAAGLTPHRLERDGRAVAITPGAAWELAAGGGFANLYFRKP
jgi:FkbM family methyltransferase